MFALLKDVSALDAWCNLPGALTDDLTMPTSIAIASCVPSRNNGSSSSSYSSSGSCVGFLDGVPLTCQDVSGSGDTLSPKCPGPTVSRSALARFSTSDVSRRNAENVIAASCCDNSAEAT